MDAAWAALEQQDEAELLEQVHAIKGLTGTLGITGLLSRARRLLRSYVQERAKDCRRK